MINRVANRLLSVGGWGATLLCLTILFLPLFVLVVFSFNRFPYGVFPLKGFTWQWYQKLLRNHNIVRAILNSIYISSFATIAALILGSRAAYASDRAIKMKVRFEAFLYVPMIAPGIILGISLAFLFHLLNLRLGLWSVVFGHVTFLAPFVFVLVSASLKRFDRRLELAGRDLGATGRQVFWLITLSVLKPTFLAAALFCWTLSFEEFIVTFFTIGSDSNLSMEVFSKLRVGVTPELNALGTLQILVAVIVGIWVSSKLEGVLD